MNLRVLWVALAIFSVAYAGVIFWALDLGLGGPSALFWVLVLVPSVVAAGSVLIWRRPRSPIGHLFLGAALAMCMVPSLLEIPTLVVFEDRGLQSWMWVPLWGFNTLTMAGVVLISVLIALLPDGRPRHARERPIGLGVASLAPDRHRALVIGNTFAWPADQSSWNAISAPLGGAPGRLIIDRGDFLARTVGNTHRLRRPSSQEAAHYTAPFPGPPERRRTRRFIDQIRGARDYLEALAEGLPTLAHLPTLFLWGTRDTFYKEKDLARLQTLFPNHETHVLEGAGHFIQSEAGPEIARVIEDWPPST